MAINDSPRPLALAGDEPAPAPTPVQPPPEVPDPVPNPPGTEVPRPDVPPEPRARSVRVPLTALAAAAALTVGTMACADDASTGPPQNIQGGNPDTDQTSPPTQPGPSGSVDQPGQDRTGAGSGAVPGQDVDEIDPPGGTYSVPDPGGSGAGGRDEPAPGASG